MHFLFTSMLNRNVWIKSINFALNDMYLYDNQALIRKKFRCQQNSSWLYGHSVYSIYICFRYKKFSQKDIILYVLVFKLRVAVNRVKGFL